MRLESRTAARLQPRAALGLIAALIALLSGCGTYSQRPTKAAAPRELPESTAQVTVSAWQARVSERIARAGGDPAALAQVPALRSPAVARPAQIVFSMTDVDALVPERDGYDVFGLLLGKHVVDTGSTWYVFVVGTVERRDYRPIGVVDIRLSALRATGESIVWKTGTADSEAMRRYRRNPIPSAGAAFPAESDQFQMRTCAPSVCVEEQTSSARWTLYFAPSDAAAEATRPASQ